jgi:cytidine deaminase
MLVLVSVRVPLRIYDIKGTGYNEAFLSQRGESAASQVKARLIVPLPAQETNTLERDLVEQARLAAENAYAPYSRQAKGAALQASDGSVYRAGNVEVATFGGSVCAETAALIMAVNAGKREFERLALFPYRFPCGSCLQWFREFGLELEVVTEVGGVLHRRRLQDLLPHSFGAENLSGV